MMRKVLIITGGKNPGHPIEARNIEIFQDIYGDTTEISSIDLSELSVRKLDEYNNFIFFTSLEGANNQMLNHILDRSGKHSWCMVFLHEAAIFNRDNHAFYRFLGVRFKEHYEYGSFTVKTERCPVTEGIGEKFIIDDELYFFEEPLYGSGSFVFCFSEKNAPLGFIKNEQPGGTLIYIALGHNRGAFTNREYRRMLKNCAGYFI